MVACVQDALKRIAGADPDGKVTEAPERSSSNTGVWGGREIFGATPFRPSENAPFQLKLAEQSTTFSNISFRDSVYSSCIWQSFQSECPWMVCSYHGSYVWLRVAVVGKGTKKLWRRLTLHPAAICAAAMISCLSYEIIRFFVFVCSFIVCLNT